MQIRSIRQISIEEAQNAADAMFVGCGYEHRSRGIASLLTRLPAIKHALCFAEFSEAIARKENEQFFETKGFSLHTVGSNAPGTVQKIFHDVVVELSNDRPAVIVDISTMTRSWHGALIRQLRMAEYPHQLRTIFAYTPSTFRRPPMKPSPNEFVAPVEGFAALGTPEFPVAAVIGLGYERGGALGLQQILDPAKTVLFVPKGGDNDPYYKEVKRNNTEILNRTSAADQFDYSIAEPSATYAMLASLISGLRESHRVVITSLGPKIFGVISFLLACHFGDVSVWRVSSGVHGQPRDSHPDLEKAVFLEVTWESPVGD